MPPTMIIADGRDRNQTLAAVLKAHLGLPWSQAKRVIERRQVRVGAQIVADPAFRVKTGKRITIAAGAVELKAPITLPQKPKPASSAKPAPEAAPIKRPKEPGRSTPPPAKPRQQAERSELPRHGDPVILFADDAVVVVDKPAGLTTMRHAEEAAEFGKGKRFLPKTLESMLPGLLGEPGRPVIAVHRIDRDTSGVVVFARTQQAAKLLMTQFRKHTAERRYLALVRGQASSGRLESTLVRDRGDGRRGSLELRAPGKREPVEGSQGKHAVTHVTVLEQYEAFALVECRLETGRTHQVRIHLGEAGTPLCGETIYDRRVNARPFPDGSGAQRPMLHAARLSFDHPITSERRSWETAPPSDFTQLLEKLRAQS